MGEKRAKTEYWTCKFCGKKYTMEFLEQGKYIEHTKIGDVVECPSQKCGIEQFLEK